MMSTTSISIRVDSDIKKQAEDLFDELGLSMSAAINIFLKRAVSQGGIPFEVKRVVPNNETREALAEYAEMRRSDSAYKRYDSFNQVMEDVLNDA